MAKIIQSNYSNEDRLRRMTKQLRLLSLLTLILLFSSWFTLGITFILAVLVSAKIRSISRERRILKHGQKGKDELLGILQSLPNNFAIVRFPTFNLNEKAFTLDFLVIGPTGVFVIKNKNWKSIGIKGKDTDDMWEITRTSNNKDSLKEYKKEEKNPIKQVSSQVFLLSQYLKGKGIHSWVQGIVYISNTNSSYKDLENITFSPDGPKIPVFSTQNDGENKVLFYIQSFQRNPSIEDFKRISSLFPQSG